MPPGLPDWSQEKPGPRGPHKLHGEVLAFLQARLVPGEPVRARELARLVRNELDIEVHPRTIERALKKTAGEHRRDLGVFDPVVRHCAEYEVLRMAALGEALPPMARSGLMLFLRRGMWGWAQTLRGRRPRSTTRSHRVTPPAPRNERTAVVHVLATIGA